MEPAPLGDDSSHEYQMSPPADATDVNTLPEGESLCGADETIPRRRPGPQFWAHGKQSPED